MQNKPFHLTRRRLAGWYAGVMALILSLGGFTVYRLIAHVEWVNMEQEMETVAEALQETVEPALIRPGKLDPSIQQLLPGICLVGTACSTNLKTQQSSIRAEQKILSRIEQGGYCMRLLDFANRTIALAQFPSSELPPCSEKAEGKEGQKAKKGRRQKAEDRGQKAEDRRVNFLIFSPLRYHRTSRVLFIQNRTPWGRLELVRSLEDVNSYLFSAQIILFISVLLAVGLIIAASWWLAGLAMQPIRQSYQQMQQFTADAAHELRTPLAALRAMTQAALKAEDLSPQEIQETLRAVDRQSYRLSQLVQNLLLLCRLDQGRSSGDGVRCCLNNLLKGLVDDFEALATAAELSLTLDIQVDSLLYVMGSEEQLYRCISNLVINAIQYTPAGGSIRLILEWNPPYAMIQVRDSGIGIAPEDRARIFHRFYRVKRESSRSKSGTGLGLAIAWAIAEAHNGMLQVESELGKGSTFTLRFPLNISKN